MHPAFIDAPGMLAAPTLNTRTVPQAEGGRCAWCSKKPAIALGPRVGVRDGKLERWEPRGCRRCVRREARQAYNRHLRACARCEPTLYCEDARALHALLHGISAVPAAG
ncbi:hypothetical protein [Streptomyces sp. NPDC051016]|uniref:hypothetical protein n=1 Tax=Streptomyces sp. NPDC051016 TaxID=3365638 RepID=UPI00379AFB98